MSPDILSEVKRIVNESKNLPQEKLEKLLGLLGRFKQRDLLYPGVIIRHLNISKERTYDILDTLKDKGILRINYELYCHSCNHFEGGIFETFGQIPDDIYCEGCGNNLDPVDNSIIVYRIV